MNQILRPFNIHCRACVFLDLRSLSINNSQETSLPPMIPRRAKIITTIRISAKMTIRMPGIPGISRGPREKGSSTTRRASPPRTKRTEEMTLPVVLPNPPMTMMISRLKVRKNVKSTGEMVVIKWARRPPATPSK